jgi:hypothetical protein
MKARSNRVANASMRRAAFASGQRTASRRSSLAPNSLRVIATVIATFPRPDTPPINAGRWERLQTSKRVRSEGRWYHTKSD